MYIQRVTAEGITVAGSGSTAVTNIGLPATFTPAAGCIYDILLRTQIPNGTEGTILVLNNDTTNYNVLQRCNGNYIRVRQLTCRKVLRVQFFDDPDHFNLLTVRC